MGSSELCGCPVYPSCRNPAAPTKPHHTPRPPAPEKTGAGASRAPWAVLSVWKAEGAESPARTELSVPAGRYHSGPSAPRRGQEEIGQGGRQPRGDSPHTTSRDRGRRNERPAEPTYQLAVPHRHDAVLPPHVRGLPRPADERSDGGGGAPRPDVQARRAVGGELRVGQFPRPRPGPAGSRSRRARGAGLGHAQRQLAGVHERRPERRRRGEDRGVAGDRGGRSSTRRSRSPTSARCRGW